MFVRENPVRGEIVQATRIPRAIVIEAADEKGGPAGGKKLFVPRGHYLIVSSSGTMKSLSPTEFAIRYSRIEQHFDCHGREKHSATAMDDVEVSAEEVRAILADS